MSESTARLQLVNQALLLPVIGTMREFQFPNPTTNAMPLVAAIRHGLISRTGEGMEDMRRVSGVAAAAAGGNSVASSLAGDSNGLSRSGNGSWNDATRRAFAQTVASQRSALTKQFSETHFEWYPHHESRQLYEEWKIFFCKWKQRHSASRGAVASSLLSSFFCTILLDERIPSDVAVEISRLIMEETVQVTVDDPMLRDPEEACTYPAFCHLAKNVATGLFPSMESVDAVQTFVILVAERVHRIH
jgi:hypothetical protein